MDQTREHLALRVVRDKVWRGEASQAVSPIESVDFTSVYILIPPRCPLYEAGPRKESGWVEQGHNISRCTGEC